MCRGHRHRRDAACCMRVFEMGLAQGREAHHTIRPTEDGRWGVTLPDAALLMKGGSKVRGVQRVGELNWICSEGVGFLSLHERRFHSDNVVLQKIEEPVCSCIADSKLLQHESYKGMRYGVKCTFDVPRSDHRSGWRRRSLYCCAERMSSRKARR